MVSITLAVPVELKHRMDRFEEINWSAVAREAFSRKVSDLEFIKKFSSESTMTEEDALRMGRELNSRLAKRRR